MVGLVASQELIKSMFVPTTDQLLLIRYWNTKRGWGFTEQDFASLGGLPRWPQAGKLLALVLDVQLGSVFRTVKEAYAILQQVHSTRRVSTDFRFTKPYLRLSPGCRHRRGLRWRMIDLGANKDIPVTSLYSPGTRTIKDPERLPHSALLWVAALHPQWVENMDGENVPWVNIPGYEVVVTREDPWDHTPGIWAEKGALDLTANFMQDRAPNWGIPVFLTH